MPDSLPDLADRYARDGYVFPLTALSTEEAAEAYNDFRKAQQVAADQQMGFKGQFSFAHIVFPFAYRLATRPEILDAVERILGPDILIWGSTLFTKAPHTESFVSWHQDLRYWGLSGDEEVSAWLAISDVDETNGCMRFAAGSHKGDIVEHKNSTDETNILTRGQEAVVNIAPEDETLVELRAGQFSLHHGKLLHCSGPNRSDRHRYGFTMNYIRPDMRQVEQEKDFAMLVRGEDRHGNFTLVPPPDSPLSPESRTWLNRILDAQAGLFEV